MYISLPGFVSSWGQGSWWLYFLLGEYSYFRLLNNLCWLIGYSDVMQFQQLFNIIVGQTILYCNTIENAWNNLESDVFIKIWISGIVYWDLYFFIFKNLKKAMRGHQYKLNILEVVFHKRPDHGTPDTLYFSYSFKSCILGLIQFSMTAPL